MLLHYGPIANHYSLGGVAERLIAPVLKTGRPKGLVSSNLTPSVSICDFRFSAPTLVITSCATASRRFSEERNEQLKRRRKSPTPRRRQRPRDNAHRYTSERTRSESGLGGTQVRRVVAR